MHGMNFDFFFLESFFVYFENLFFLLLYPFFLLKIAQSESLLLIMLLQKSNFIFRIEFGESSY